MHVVLPIFRILVWHGIHIHTNVLLKNNKTEQIFLCDSLIICLFQFFFKSQSVCRLLCWLFLFCLHHQAHTNHRNLFTFPSAPNNAFTTVGIISTIQVRMTAIPVPPGTGLILSTITTGFVIILVLSAEVPSILVSQ